MAIDWLSQLDQQGYVWTKAMTGASQTELEQLAAFMGRPLPHDYETFMLNWNGSTIRYNDLWHVRVWPARDVPSWSTGYGFTAQKMPGAVAFGDDGGGEALVFDLRPEHSAGQYLVYTVNLVTLEWDEAIKVADSFHDLLLLRRPHIIVPDRPL